MTLLEVWHLKLFLTLLGGFRVQHVYRDHNQVFKKQIKMVHLIWNGRSRKKLVRLLQKKIWYQVWKTDILVG